MCFLGWRWWFLQSASLRLRGLTWLNQHLGAFHFDQPISVPFIAGENGPSSSIMTSESSSVLPDNNILFGDTRYYTDTRHLFLSMLFLPKNPSVNKIAKRTVICITSRPKEGGKFVKMAYTCWPARQLRSIIACRFSSTVSQYRLVYFTSATKTFHFWPIPS